MIDTRLQPGLRYGARLAAGLACVLAAGCATRDLSKLSAPAFEMPARFAATGTAPRDNRWWRAFDDPGLDTLVRTALTDNFSLRAAYARVEQARAMLAGARADLFPSVTASASDRGRYDTNNDNSFGSGFDFGSAGAPGNAATGNSGGGASSGAPDGGGGFSGLGFSPDFDTSPFSNSGSVGVAASYELDLFGRLRNQKRAAALGVRASRQALQAAAMTTAGDIANNWYQLQELRARIDLLKSQIATNKHILELTTFSFNNGQSPAADVLRQRSTVLSVKGQLQQAIAQKHVVEHALAVLVGSAPQTFSPPSGKLPALPALPETGVPAALLMRRPDVRRDFDTIAADNRRVAAALANQYPQISLTANGSSSSSGGALLSNWIFSLAGQLTQTVFDAGAKAAQVDQQRAVVDEDVADYQKTMLGALQEVADALTNEAHQKRFLARVDKQLEVLKKTVGSLRLRYLRGASNYLDVLNATLNRQNLQVQRLTGRYNLLQYRINLYRALAGGIDNARLGRGSVHSAANTVPASANDPRS